MEKSILEKDFTRLGPIFVKGQEKHIVFSIKTHLHWHFFFLNVNIEEFETTMICFYSQQVYSLRLGWGHADPVGLFGLFIADNFGIIDHAVAVRYLFFGQGGEHVDSVFELLGEEVGFSIGKEVFGDEVGGLFAQRSVGQHPVGKYHDMPNILVVALHHILEVAKLESSVHVQRNQPNISHEE